MKGRQTCITGDPADQKMPGRVTAVSSGVAPRNIVIHVPGEAHSKMVKSGGNATQSEAADLIQTINRTMIEQKKIEEKANTKRITLHKMPW